MKVYLDTSIISHLEGYKPIEIVSPSALLESEDDTDE